MTQLRSLLISSAVAALAATAAVAQTSTQPPVAQAGQAAQSAPPSAPAAHGVEMPSPAPQAQSRQTLTAPTSPDPLVQKRNADARANADYRDAKKTSKTQYKEQVDNAKVNREADRQAAANQLKTDAQAGHGPQVPDDETKH